MSQPTEKFDLWCIVELMGHSKIAGRCTEQNIAGTNMLRVDVPETNTHPAFSKLYGAAAIYAINPVTEETAKAMANRIETSPIQVWEIQKYLDKDRAAAALPTHQGFIVENEEEDDEMGAF